MRRKHADRVMHVQHIEARELRHIHELAGEHQFVGLVIEERIVANAHLVVKHVRMIAQTYRTIVGDEVDHVALLGQGHAQFGGHHAASTKGGVTHDPDTHRVQRSVVGTNRNGTGGSHRSTTARIVDRTSVPYHRLTPFSSTLLNR